MKRAYTFDTMLKKIEESNPSQESCGIELESQPFLDDDQAQLLQNAIESSKRKTLRFSGLSFTHWNGDSIFRKCMSNPTISTIEFPIWKIINSPGQRPLMEMAEKLPLIVDAYNEQCEKDLIAFEYFKMLNNRVFKLAAVKSIDDQNGAEFSQGFLDPQIIDKRIGPFLKSPKKNVTLGLD